MVLRRCGNINLKSQRMCSGRGHFLKLKWNWFKIICTGVEILSRKFHAGFAAGPKDLPILIMHSFFCSRVYMIKVVWIILLSGTLSLVIPNIYLRFNVYNFIIYHILPMIWNASTIFRSDASWQRSSTNFVSNFCAYHHLMAQKDLMATPIVECISQRNNSVCHTKLPLCGTYLGIQNFFAILVLGKHGWY